MHTPTRACHVALALGLSLLGLAAILSLRPPPAAVAQAAAAFTEVTTSLPGVVNGSLAWGDYDGDGDLDLLLTGFTGAERISRIYRNDGGGAFTDLEANLLGVSHGSAVWGDYDNDGRLDVLLCGDSGSGYITRLYHNDGLDTFSDSGAALAGVAYGCATFADYDMDGDLDILLMGTSRSGITTRLYRNDGGTFSEVAGTGLPALNYSAAAWGDYDGDGDPDLLLTGFDGPILISAVYRNDGATFANIGAPLTGVQDGAVAWGDYDGDGDLDILLAGERFKLGLSHVYRNEAGTFADSGEVLTALSNGAVAWGDHDNDGDLDFVLTGYGSTGYASQVYRNDAGSFVLDAELPGLHYSAAAWGDYDNDGDLDLVLSGQDSTGAVTRLYRNDTAIANTPPSAPAGLSAVFHGDSVELSWQAATDGRTPPDGLTYNLRAGTTPGGIDLLAPMASADGYRHVPQLGNAYHGLTATLALAGLPPGASCYWSVQAIDSAWAGSPFAGEATFAVPTAPAGVAITAPAPPVMGAACTFTATVSPATATLPLDYAWQASGQAPVTHTARPSHTDTVAFTWDVTGTQTVTVTAANCLGAVTATQLVTVYAPVEAGFAADQTAGIAPLTVSFANLSTGDYSTSLWDFGDGSPPSTDTNPLHTYTQGGVYTVTLTVDGPGGSDTLARPGYVTVYMPVQAAFTAAPTSGPVPLEVRFYNDSSGDYDACAWAFGDGATSAQGNPTHTYALPGTYTPTLTVDGPGGSDTLARPAYVEALPPPPAQVALDGPSSAGLNALCPFTATVTPLTTTLPLTYTWQATGHAPIAHTGGLTATLSLSWDAPGPKTVTVTVANAVVTATAGHPLTIHAPPLAGFTASPSSGPAPLTVAFSNTSSGEFTSLWDFGDGSTSSLDSPVHTYQAPGLYTATLTVSGPGGSDAAQGEITVLPAPPAGLTIAGPLTATLGATTVLTATVTPLTTTLPLTYTWQAAGQLAVTHESVLGHTDEAAFTWGQPGPQTVTVTAGNPGGEITATHALTVHAPPQAGFHGSPTTGPAPLTVHFSNTSRGDFDSSQWDFGDGATSTLESPAHTYARPGAYTVTLTVDGPAGSDWMTRPSYVTVRPGVYLPLVLRSVSTAPAPLSAWRWPGRIPE